MAARMIPTKIPSIVVIIIIILRAESFVDTCKMKAFSFFFFYQVALYCTFNVSIFNVV